MPKFSFLLFLLLGSAIGCDRAASVHPLPPALAPVPIQAPAPAPDPDPIGLEKILSDAAQDHALTMGLTGFFAIEFAAGWELEDTNPVVESITNGTIQFQGRVLPAGQIRARFHFVNRQKGERKTKFVALAAGDDREFDMWRSLSLFDAESEAASGVAEWKTKNHFKPL
jgi:hypothetical protein